MRDVAAAVVKRRGKRGLKLKEWVGGDRDDEPAAAFPCNPSAFPEAEATPAHLATPEQPSNLALALDAYHDGLRHGGFGPDEPLTKLYQAQGQVAMAAGELMDALPARLESIVARSEANAKAVLDVALAAAEADRAAAQREFVAAAAPLIGTEIRRAARRFDRWLALTVGGVAAVLLLAAVSGGYLVGRADGRQEADRAALSMEAAVRAAGPDAGTWATLIGANDIQKVLAICRDGPAQRGTANGVPWCAMPMYLARPDRRALK